MKTILPYLPLLNFLIIPLMGWIVKHERQHAKIWLLIRQVCGKLKIETGEGA